MTETRLIAIDPGDVFVGVAFFICEQDDPWNDPESKEWRCQDAQEWKPWDFADALATTLIANEVDVVVYERFRLYADKAHMQTGSEFETSQLIGVIKYLVRIHNLHVERHDAAERDRVILSCEQQGGMHADPSTRPRHVQIVGQMADIKKPTAGILRTKKIKSIAKPIARDDYEGRDHVVDAELHGWKYILDGSQR